MRFRFLKLLISVFLVLTVQWSTSCLANEAFRPSHPSQLPVDSTSDLGYHVDGAQVAYANYARIRADFRQTERMTDAEIDAWILDNFAFVSESQLRLRGLWTSDFEVNPAKSKLIHRPRNYIRSGMLEADGGGMVDIKGVGYPPGPKLDRALNETFVRRRALQEARQDFADATTYLRDAEAALGANPKSSNLQFAREVAVESLNWAKSRLAAAEDRLTHMDGSMRFGEAIAETEKQLSLQNIANFLNSGGEEQESPLTPIETVESYFVVHLPWKVKSADGTMEEAVALYGRQATAGHGRGSTVPSDIAYNPSPGAVRQWTEAYIGHNALQISNSGAVFDYGSIAVTHPEALKRHGYTHYSADDVKNGKYFNLFDSTINRTAYDLARSMDEETTSWEAKRNWLENQFSALVPYLDAKPAALNGIYGEMADLYARANAGRFGADDGKRLIRLIRASNDRVDASLGMNSHQARADRITHLTLQTVLSGLDRKGAETLLKSGARNLVNFMKFTRQLVALETEGVQMGDVPIPPAYELWDAMRESKNAVIRSLGVSVQLEAFAQSQVQGSGNPRLEAVFSAALRDSSLAVRLAAVKTFKAIQAVAETDPAVGVSKTDSRRLSVNAIAQAKASASIQRLLARPKVRDAISSAQDEVDALSELRRTGGLSEELGLCVGRALEK